MTIEELRSTAGRILEDSIAFMREHGGQLSQKFYLYKCDESLDVIVLDGHVTNSEYAKSEFSIQLKARIASGNVIAVIMVSDCFFSHMTREQAAIVRRLRINVEEAEAFGLCVKQEAILVTLQSPLLQQQTVQTYRRLGDGSTFELVGGPEITESEEAIFAGRFMGLFAQPRAASRA